MSTAIHAPEAGLGAVVDQIAAALGRSGVFANLPLESRSRLAQRASLVSFDPGAQILRAGDPADAAYVILAGEAEVAVHTLGGREVRLSALATGAVLGEMAALDGGPRSADVVAVRRVQAARIARSVLLELIDSEPGMARALIAALCARVRDANVRLEGAQIFGLAERLADLLLTSCGGAQGLVALTQTEIARRIAASREKVNRTLHGWADEGHVRISRAGVRVVRPEALRALIQARRAE